MARKSRGKCKHMLTLLSVMAAALNEPETRELVLLPPGVQKYVDRAGDIIERCARVSCCRVLVVFADLSVDSCTT